MFSIFLYSDSCMKELQYIGSAYCHTFIIGKGKQTPEMFREMVEFDLDEVKRLISADLPLIFDAKRRAVNLSREFGAYNYTWTCHIRFRRRDQLKHLCQARPSSNHRDELMF